MEVEDQYLIENPSQELLIDAIKNPPRDILRMNLTFLADGIKPPFSDDNPSEYLKLCEEKNIIPFSFKKIGYNFNVEGYIPGNLEGAKKFFGDGRTNRILFEMGMFELNSAELKKFNEIYFPSLLENNYHVLEGLLTLSEHRVGSDYSKGYASDVSIDINWVGSKGLELRIKEDYIDEEERANLEKWFVDLKKNHSHPL
jgi:hypothetical protein